MVSSMTVLTTLDEPGHIETWIRCFLALERIKKIKDEKANERENKITSLFLAMAGYEAVKKISTMASLRKLKESTYEEIVGIIQKKYTTNKNTCYCTETRINGH